ncbi:MAG: ABC transporter permease [Alistipes sp.]|nr:ABC transporter permease [Alistipes sp.]
MFSPKSHSVINIIVAVSLVAVAVPTAALVVLLAVFNGLNATIERLYSSVDADIEILAERGQTFAEESIDLDVLRDIEGIVAVAPYIEQSVMLSVGDRHAAVTLRGIDSLYTDALPIASLVGRGSIEAATLDGDIVLGYGLAADIGAYNLGSEISLYALNRKQLSTLLPMSGLSRAKAQLGGIIDSNADIDATLALTSIDRLQRLANYPDRLSGIVVNVADDSDTKAVCRALKGCVGEDFKVRTREEKNASMNAILRMEKVAVLLIGALIAIVAALSIVGSVVMLLTDKGRDIMTLRSMGADRSLIRNIFVGEGILLTMLGTAVGAVVGIGLSLGQEHFGWVGMPEGGAIIESYPVDLRTGDTMLVVAIFLVIGILVSRLTVAHTLRKKRL